MQGPESWHPAPDALKQAAKQCADLAANNKLSIPELAVKAAIHQAGSGVAVHLMGRFQQTALNPCASSMVAATGWQCQHGGLWFAGAYYAQCAEPFCCTASYCSTCQVVLVV